jgi:hypothetical protein
MAAIERTVTVGRQLEFRVRPDGKLTVTAGMSEGLRMVVGPLAPDDLLDALQVLFPSRILDRA